MMIIREQKNSALFLPQHDPLDIFVDVLEIVNKIQVTFLTVEYLSTSLRHFFVSIVRRE